MAEWTSSGKNVFDLDQLTFCFTDAKGKRRTHWVGDVYLKKNIVDMIRSGEELRAWDDMEREPGTKRFYTYMLSCHDSDHYIVKGSPITIGYQAIFAPFIPLWYVGEEWDNAPRFFVDYFYRRDKHPVPKKWRLYGNVIDWAQKEENRDFFELVKKDDPPSGGSTRRSSNISPAATATQTSARLRRTVRGSCRRMRASATAGRFSLCRTTRRRRNDSASRSRSGKRSLRPERRTESPTCWRIAPPQRCETAPSKQKSRPDSSASFSSPPRNEKAAVCRAPAACFCRLPRSGGTGAAGARHGDAPARADQPGHSGRREKDGLPLPAAAAGSGESIRTARSGASCGPGRYTRGSPLSDSHSNSIRPRSWRPERSLGHRPGFSSASALSARRAKAGSKPSRSNCSRGGARRRARKGVTRFTFRQNSGLHAGYAYELSVRVTLEQGTGSINFELELANTGRETDRIRIVRASVLRNGSRFRSGGFRLPGAPREAIAAAPGTWELVKRAETVSAGNFSPLCNAVVIRTVPPMYRAVFWRNSVDCFSLEPFWPVSLRPGERRKWVCVLTLIR